MANNMVVSATNAGAAAASVATTRLKPAGVRPPPRHAAFVRVTHWLSAIAFLALLVTGCEIVLSHPRFYWGETGNVNTGTLFKIPVPSSRALVPTGYGYVLPDQNGWSRALHFQSAWLIVFVGIIYVGIGFAKGHFWRTLLPSRSQLSPRALASSCADHLRFKHPSEDEAYSYNVLQRLSYLAVIFVAIPMIVWTGLAMSPAFTSAFPSSVILLGGRQTARTLHFFLTILLTLFLLVHVFMVFFAGFRKRMAAMITGRVPQPKERA
ncbi:conserved hypothetical protein [Candidatus Koribacter versatilis Ellin345]|uniref:Cytochrome b561 bacterial/Ni-hydrogenase domain-containing protein n=1 Tax=Koribacter versatilis (strain Ellin345) TaxID=204669 RepID=Q1IJK8_KORVE|nr:cytochrome b/b6 domain-containing protein [Candidatus Koribacter versatilis]ABF42942.1 conserved hypothetical protein [Candidatus Koribacter versatilis Ellin345]